MNYFEESRIFAGKNIAIFKALLFFNLPHDLIFNRGIRPKLGYCFPSDDGQNNKIHELKDLIEEQEDNEEVKMTADGKPV